MNQMRNLVAGLVANPRLLRSIVEDPEVLRRLGNVLAVSRPAVVKAISRALNGEPSRYHVQPVPPRTNGQTLPITGIVSLAAMVGTVAVLGTVALVALSAGGVEIDEL